MTPRNKTNNCSSPPPNPDYLNNYKRYKLENFTIQIVKLRIIPNMIVSFTSF